ncbi:hypothetical protein [Streptomyces wuyuanensis]|uniref:Uncharacterized protein n=1 Tax=Streptomyces wuyuanensis TaxID=1196353 RepID=A0A1G9TG61_9ACTN|nr:hypothetical protein [Streptomyces wuyuanensis]SDM46697.1 hypothetical protein SAMN05444921_108259 [Streptomyces wuyuanensis]
MRSTRTAKRATMAGLFVLAGIITGAGAGLGSTAHSTTVTHADDMPWGIVKPVGPAMAYDDDMPWG